MKDSITKTNYLRDTLDLSRRMVPEYIDNSADEYASHSDVGAFNFKNRILNQTKLSEEFSSDETSSSQYSETTPNHNENEKTLVNAFAAE